MNVPFIKFHREPELIRKLKVKIASGSWSDIYDFNVDLGDDFGQIYLWKMGAFFVYFLFTNGFLQYFKGK